MIDLTSDLHGRAVEYASDQDRRFFLLHPDVDAYGRPPVDHEWCLPDGSGGCTVPFDGTVVAVIVNRIGDGFRTRRPLVAVDEGGAHHG